MPFVENVKAFEIKRNIQKNLFNGWLIKMKNICLESMNESTGEREPTVPIGSKSIIQLRNEKGNR